MIRQENVTAIIGSMQIKADSNLKITAGIGKGYNTCSFEGLNLVGNVGEQITISINGDTYVFIATEKNYAERGRVTIDGKGIPFVLENQSKSDEILDYTDSDSLIEGERGMISVQNDIPNIVFGNQTYNKSNTPMGRILDMVNVVGGEAFEVGSVLHLAEIAAIPTAPTITHSFEEGEIFSYAYSDSIGQSVVLKQVLINPITDDLYVEPSITVEYDEDTLTASCFFNPSLSVGYEYSFLGMTPRTPTIVTKTETILLSEESYFRTIGGIDSIKYLKIDGEVFEDYILYSPYNIVRFTEQITGSVEISYTTKNITAFVNLTTNFVVKYQCVKCSGTIEVDDSSSTSSQNCKLDISSDLTFESGGYVECYKDNDVKLVFVDTAGASNVATIREGTHAGGGKLVIKYAGSGSTTFMNNITSAINMTIDTESGTVEYNEDLSAYVVYLSFKPQSIISVREGSISLTGYTYVDADVPYISFLASDEGREVDISMYVEVVTISIPAPGADHTVTLLDAVGCSGVATSEFTNEEDAPCSVPAYLTVDVAGTFDVPIINAYGKTVLGNGGIGSHVVDEFGKIRVYISSAGTFIIDCANIKANAKITIDATGVLGA